MVNFIRDNPAQRTFANNMQVLSQTRVNDARLDEAARQNATRSALADVVAGNGPSAGSRAPGLLPANSAKPPQPALASFSAGIKPPTSRGAEGKQSGFSHVAPPAQNPAAPGLRTAPSTPPEAPAAPQSFNLRAAKELARRGLGGEAANYLGAHEKTVRAVADKVTDRIMVFFKAGDPNSIALAKNLAHQHGLLGDGLNQIPAAMFESAEARSIVVDATERLRAAGVKPQYMGTALTSMLKTNQPLAQRLSAALRSVPQERKHAGFLNTDQGIVAASQDATGAYTTTPLQVGGEPAMPYQKPQTPTYAYGPGNNMYSVTGNQASPVTLPGGNGQPGPQFVANGTKAGGPPKVHRVLSTTDGGAVAIMSDGSQLKLSVNVLNESKWNPQKAVISLAGDIIKGSFGQTHPQVAIQQAQEAITALTKSFAPPPASGQAQAAGQTPQMTDTPQAIPTAPYNPSHRVIGKVYSSPAGTVKWMGNGWERVP